MREGEVGGEGWRKEREGERERKGKGRDLLTTSDDLYLIIERVDILLGLPLCSQPEAGSQR